MKRQKPIREARIILRQGLRPMLSKPGMAVDYDRILDAQEVLAATGYSDAQANMVIFNAISEIEKQAIF